MFSDWSKPELPQRTLQTKTCSNCAAGDRSTFKPGQFFRNSPVFSARRATWKQRATSHTTAKNLHVWTMKARSLLAGKIPSTKSLRRSTSPNRSTAAAATMTKKQETAAANGAAVDAVTKEMTKLEAAGSWETDELTYDKHHQGEGGKAPSPPTEDDHHRGIFSLPRLHKQHKEKTHPLDWGYPGELSKEEVECYVKFREQVEKRGGEFRKTVYSFGEIEGEAWALTRWLRARKYVYDDVITMVEKATECRAEPGEHDFYPDPEEALGVDPFVYIQQYPQLYSGNAKSGCPLFISKPGKLSVDGMECITTLDGIYRYHWHVMMHDYKNRLIENKKKNVKFTRFQCVCVLDLDGLSTAQITSRALNIIQKQTEIDSLCFPETMERMIVVNVPRFFALTWRLIKGWIDPRTAGKVELISSRKQWEARLKELVDVDQIPSDYGGTGPDTNDTLMSTAPGGMTKQTTDLWHVRTHHSHTFEVGAGEEVDVLVYTRGVNGATFSVADKDHKNKVFVQGVDVIHKGNPEDENEPPTNVKITSEGRIAGPAHLKIRADSKTGRFGGSETFMVVLNYYPKSG